MWKILLWAKIFIYKQVFVIYESILMAYEYFYFLFDFFFLLPIKIAYLI